ncbi:MAG: serine/threonine-protein phosphatase [archaeon]|nr:serine/threonine-protein phosphatase [archaeon]
MEDKWLESLYKGECLPENDVKILCDKVKELLIEESNVQPVSAPVTVCGDIHGQFYDLKELFRTGGEIPNTRYVFLGDYVDRGYNSVETLELLLCLKLRYPDHILLLRGNHESRQISFTYGFYEEINRKYGNIYLWKVFTDIFDYLAIGAIIEGKIFCIHGGLSPYIACVDQIRLLNRKAEIPHDGALCDLVWSDPDDIETWMVSSRGAGWMFGSKVVDEFNHINDLELICRAHQLVDEGFKYWFPNENLVTVWSAPNYCYRCGNKASILKFSVNLERTFLMFNDVPESAKSLHPKSLVPYFL